MLRGWYRMKHAPTPPRPGMTALAAALTLTATPLFAQAADPAPVTVSPPPPVVTAPTSPITASVPTPTPDTAAGALGAPTPTMAPIVHQPEETAAPVAERAARTPRAITSRATDRATPPTRVERATSAPTPAAVANAAPPVVNSRPVAPLAPIVRAAPAPVPQPTPQTADTDVLPIAGGVGAAILLLGGAVALGRRRRDDNEAVVYETQPEMRVGAAPMAAVVVPAPAQAVTANTTTTLPSGFDVSRFGRHTQAAYRGPTPENPSLSLKKRLKIASFYDGRERMAAEGGVATLAATPPPPAPAPAARRTDHITVQAAKVRPNFKPAFSR